MRACRGRAIALWSAGVALVVITAAGIAFREELTKEWQRYTQHRVRTLVRQAAEEIRNERHADAAITCQRILRLNPDHRVAKYWLRDLTRKQQPELAGSSSEPYSQIFMGDSATPERWAIIRHRLHQASSLPAGEASQSELVEGADDPLRKIRGE